MTREELKSLKADYPYLTAKRIEVIAKCSKKKTMRGVRNELKRANDEFAALDNVTPEQEIKRIVIRIKWTRYNNASATAYYERYDGTSGYCKDYARGGNYDKCAKVVSGILNQLIKNKAWKARKKDIKPPYGLYIKDDYTPYFDLDDAYCVNVARYCGGYVRHTVNVANYDEFVFDF